MLARLPEERVRGYYDLWPRIVLEPSRCARPAAAAPEALDRMDEALGWLCWLEPDERRLVWLRADGMPWKWITHRLGIGRTTAWQRWRIALLKIATRLNARSEQYCPNIKLRTNPILDMLPASLGCRDPLAHLEPLTWSRRALFCGVAVALEAARAPSAGGDERGGGEAGVGPATSERGAPRLWRPLASGPGRVSRPPSPVRAHARRRVGCEWRQWWITSCRTVVIRSCFGTRRTGLRSASAAMMPRPRARAAGADDRRVPDPRARRGEVISKRGCLQGPGAPRAVCRREIQEGGIRPLSGGIPEFRPVTAHRFVATFVRF